MDNDNVKINTETANELKARFELLPKELQDTITSSDYQMKLFELAKKYKLTYDKLGQLEVETTMVLLGMTPTEEYEEDLNEQLGINGEILSGLIKDINDQVFFPIREQLKKVYINEPEKKETQRIPTMVRAYDTKDTTPKTPVETPMQKSQADIFTKSGIEIVGQTPPVPETPKPTPSGPISLGEIKKQASSFQDSPFTRKMDTGPVYNPPATVNNLQVRPYPLPLNIPIPTPPKPQTPISNAPSIVAKGLGGVVANPNTTKDYSIPNLTGGGSKAGDPYREKI